MSDLSATREELVLQNIETGDVYVSLHTADEGDEPDGSNEVGAADYSRQQLAASDITVTKNVGSASTLENDVEINWGVTQNNWGTVTHGALWDDTIGNNGNPETATVALGNSGSVPSGVEVKIDANQLTFEVD